MQEDAAEIERLGKLFALERARASILKSTLYSDFYTVAVLGR